MAKSIKAIKCPTCGSSKVNELRLDYYKCMSCATEFFLDTDDITINHMHSYEKFNLKPQLIKKYALISIITIFAFIFLIKIFSKSPAPNPHKDFSTQPVRNVETPKQINYKWYNSELFPFENINGSMDIIVLGTIIDSAERFSNENTDYYYGIYDAKTLQKKTIKKFDLPKLINKSDRYDVRFQLFEDGNIYFIINEKWIYQLDKASLEILNMNDAYKIKNEDLTTGIAKANFKHRNSAAAFEFVLNNGKNIIYYPLINKTYTDKQWWEALSKQTPNPALKTFYKFSSKSTDYPEENIQLIQYTVKNQKGYPYIDIPDFKWSKDYGRSGIFTGGEPHVKRLINLYNQEKSKIINYKILDNDRHYLAPSVLAFNDQEILIGFKATAADDELYTIQLLNTKDASIIKTFDFQLKRLQKNNYIVNDGYIIQNDDYDYIDKTGKIIQSIKTDKLRIDNL